MLNKVNYISNETVITAENLNEIQDEIIKNFRELNNIKTFINQLYPIGSIYLSTTSTSPASFIGGAWEQIKDRFLLGTGNIYGNGTIGGEANHTLIQTETPNYLIGFLPQAVMGQHSNWSNGGIRGALQYRGNRNTVTANSGTTDPQWGYDIYTNGGNQSHNNMPPYLVVYIWKRIS